MTFPASNQGKVILVTRGTETRVAGNYVAGSTYREVTGIFNPGSSSELIQGQDTVITHPAVYLPAGTQLGAFDAVIVGGTFVDATTKPVGGDLYEVDGSPNAWGNPYTGHVAGVEVRLQRVTG